MSVQISTQEFADRRERLCEKIREAGFDGVLVCSRGGGTLDRFADVYYLTGFYTAFPYIPDVPLAWSGRAHAFVLLSAAGDERLVIDVPIPPSVQIDEKNVISADFVTDAVCSTMRALGLGNGEVGLIGADALPANLYREFCEKLPGVNWREAQELINRLKAVKSPAEVELLRRASELGSRVMDVTMEAAREGMSHGEVMAKAFETLVSRRGMLYNAFIRSGRGGIDPHFTRSSLPTWNSTDRLEDGQFFCAGLSGVLDGYYFDLARCRPIGRASNAQIDVFESAISIVETGMSACKAGNTGGKVMKAGANRQAELAFPLGGSFQGFGHGIGLGWDDPWLATGVEHEIRPGMVICVEKWLMREGYAADFEETVLVTEDGNEKLTDAKMRYW